jgi:hypothetical protein
MSTAKQTIDKHWAPWTPQELAKKVNNRKGCKR